jgi:GT2 family glycosyltransferase
MTETPIAFDAVVVAYHSGAVLESALRALRAFAPECRVIVVDNSPDDPSAAEAVAALDNAARVAEPANVGFAAAVNDGLARCSADVVLLANPDIHSLSGSVDEIVRIFASDPRAAAVTVRLVDERGRLQHCRRRISPGDLFGLAIGTARLPVRLRRALTPAMLEWDHAEERVVDQATGALLFLRRAALTEVGALDTRFFMYWEETDWLERARHAGWHLVYTPHVGAIHAVGGSSAEIPASNWLLLVESTYVYARKHFGLPTVLGLRLVWAAGDLVRLLTGLRAASAHRVELRERLRLHLGLARR